MDCLRDLVPSCLRFMDIVFSKREQLANLNFYHMFRANNWKFSVFSYTFI